MANYVQNLMGQQGGNAAPNALYEMYQRLSNNNANLFRNQQPQIRSKGIQRPAAVQQQQPEQALYFPGELAHEPTATEIKAQQGQQPQETQQDFDVSSDDKSFVFESGMFAPTQSGEVIPTASGEAEGLFAGANDNSALGSSSVVNRVRSLIGKIPYQASDGTNCMRTMGIALAGTPYEGQINVDQAISTATEQGQLMLPEKYAPKAGDMAVVEDGYHIVMVTEDGGTIQNGQSRNGVYESGASPTQMFKSGVKYYIRTSDYNS